MQAVNTAKSGGLEWTTGNAPSTSSVVSVSTSFVKVEIWSVSEENWDNPPPNQDISPDQAIHSVSLLLRTQLSSMHF